MAQTKIASVTSEPQPQSGQDHRSSGNFSSEGYPSDTQYFLWEVTNVDGTPNQVIHFDVKEDKSVQIDHTPYPNCYSGKQDTPMSSRSLYIANPQNATANFIVTLYAVS